TVGPLAIASGNGEDVYNDAIRLLATSAVLSGGNFEHLVVGTATATAQVNDTVDTTTVNLSASTVLENAADTSYVFTATLSNASQGDTTIVTDLGNIVIHNGQTTGRSEERRVGKEDTYRDSTQLTPTIQSASGGNVESLLDRTSAATSHSDVTATDPTVNLSASTVLENAADTSYVFTATLSNASQGDTTIVTDLGNIVIHNGQTTG